MPVASSIGVALPDTLTRIVSLDDPSRPLPPGEAGELLVSGPQVFRGYFGNPDETNKALYQDESGRTWLRTGDIAQIDEKGFVTILDRRKHMINHSGLKVYPSRVERVLKMHTKVADVAVAGRPHPRTTENVVAYVVTTENGAERSKLTEQLQALCREHLAPYEVPSDIEYVDELPRTALGKLQKHKLSPTGSTSAGNTVKTTDTEPAATTATKETT
jgi:long-chain acyl-CoA synthetase